MMKMKYEYVSYICNVKCILIFLRGAFWHSLDLGFGILGPVKND